MNIDDLLEGVCMLGAVYKFSKSLLLKSNFLDRLSALSVAGAYFCYFGSG